MYVQVRIGACRCQRIQTCMCTLIETHHLLQAVAAEPLSQGFLESEPKSLAGPDSPALHSDVPLKPARSGQAFKALGCHRAGTHESRMKFG